MSMTITVKHLTAKDFKITIEEDKTVLDLKKACTTET